MTEEQVDSNNYGTIRDNNTENEIETSHTLLEKIMTTGRKPMLINTLIFLIIVFVFITFQLWIQPTKRGFFCDDETIRYPFKQDTVSPNALIIFSVLPNILIIFYGERKNTLNAKNSNYVRSKKYIQIMFQFIVNFMWGLILLCSFLNIIKVSVGRHRPYFLEICKPDVLKNQTCSDHSYILNYTCTGTNIGLIKESSLSFPSGHSAISFFAATFFFLYVQNRMIFIRRCYLLKSVIQFTAVVLAAFTAVSRIFDYHHHPEDVAVGTIIGILFGYYFYFYNMFYGKRKNNKNDTVLSDGTAQHELLLNNERIV
ncbi:Phosphatidic acid phosphatase type 2/haloperoxidase domain-containing protein [Strongyloides ratti]|uniref:Phosphatidic acid phosphatase type 2/haloperoxidase domain-containing protein n=1 Tax=Strongyloides ratti TaxID=34506 RepID=A0A090KRF8_STRRB|nr:Phosphatidic acid phosphatase type 2/haloperoxidase domain-containing protein [Strongyloides ratti]CEF60089.1 Phosphatidic acid phosphatase type 2/haloperoxidase domain-containing protein [Strongyloides ratti]